MLQKLEKYNLLYFVKLLALSELA